MRYFGVKKMGMKDKKMMSDAEMMDKAGKQMNMQEKKPMMKRVRAGL